VVVWSEPAKASVCVVERLDEKEDLTAFAAVPGLMTVIEGPILPNDGRPVVVEAHESRQNILHHIRRLISGDIDSSSTGAMNCPLASLRSEYSRCRPNAVAMRSVAPISEWASLGRLR
jgi:hypothetical protein